MNVCFVLENFYPYVGGAETLFMEYTARLAKAGCTVKVVTSNSGGVNGTVSYDGVEVHHFPWRGFFDHPVPKAKDLREFIKWSDVVHTATLTAAPIALSVAKEFNKPCLITIFEVWANKWFWVEKNYLRSTLYYLFERYVITRNYSYYHAISESTQKDLVKAGIENRLITAIYPGIEKKATGQNGDGVSAHKVHPIAGSDAAENAFLFFGRPGKSKGIFVLFEAIKAIRTRLPKGFKFIYIVSNRPLSEKNRLRRLVQKHALEDVIAVKDSLPEEELVKAIEAAYCIIVPSITEGFGLSAAETCLLGKPIIVSDAGSLPEVVFGKVLFFENRNIVDLSNKILLATEDKFESIAERTFSWDTSTRGLLELYENLTKKHHR